MSENDSQTKVTIEGGHDVDENGWVTSSSRLTEADWMPAADAEYEEAVRWPAADDVIRWAITSLIVVALEGYQRQGKWAIWLYFLISIVAMFTVTAAVTFVTAGMLNNLLGINIDGTLMSGIILAFCTALLAIGKFAIANHVSFNLLENCIP